jgi:Dullard-like phosphatase family protein
MLQEAAA